MQEIDNIIEKYRDKGRLTSIEKTGEMIEKVLSVLSTIINLNIPQIKVSFELLFDYAINNKIPLKQQDYWQNIILDFKCKEFEEMEDKK